MKNINKYIYLNFKIWEGEKNIQRVQENDNKYYTNKEE